MRGRRTQSERSTTAAARGGEVVSIPGNFREASGDQREAGSSSRPPPRHWRRKAKAARVRGRRVRSRRSFEAKDVEEDGGGGRREEE